MKRARARNAAITLYHVQIVIAIACISVAASYGQQDESNNPFTNDPTAIAAGKVLYQKTCQACHGGEARGDRGPALTASGDLLALDSGSGKPLWFFQTGGTIASSPMSYSVGGK